MNQIIFSTIRHKNNKFMPYEEERRIRISLKGKDILQDFYALRDHMKHIFNS